MKPFVATVKLRAVMLWIFWMNLRRSWRPISAMWRQSTSRSGANQEKARAEEEARDYQNQYDTLTSEIEDIRQKKRDLLLGANLPLPGLSVEDGELVYMGKPWDCMSGSDPAEGIRRHRAGHQATVRLRPPGQAGTDGP